jgi:hypothetical protein
MPNEENDPVLLLLRKIREQIDDVVELVQHERQEQGEDDAVEQ